MEGFLYEKIINYILEEMQSGRLVKGSKIPTESELMEQFGVSRITLTILLLLMAIVTADF